MSTLASSPPRIDSEPWMQSQHDSLLAAYYRISTGQQTQLDHLWADPSLLMRMAGMPPDLWQQRFLETDSMRMLVLCGRQTGKSTVAAAQAIRTAYLEAPADILLLSPSLRQSGELFRKKVLPIHQAANLVPAIRETMTELEFENGSRIISLPENEASIRGFSGVRLLIIDEASRVSDDLYKAVRPMLSISRGRLVAMSTPFGKRGFFFDAFQDNTERWERTVVRADECPRHTPEFLEEEREELGDRWYNQEYLCEFVDSIDSVFRHEDIMAAIDMDAEPLILDLSE